MIGIAITTYNRPKVLEITLAKIKEFAPKDAMIVIVDDASETPHPETTFKFKKNQGTPVVKNKCLEILYNAGCTHIFLFDNDFYPVVKGWERPYIESKEPHLCYTFANGKRQIISTKGNISVWTNPNGCLMYMERKVLDKVGGFDTDFKFYGGWHKNYSRRIFNVGLTSYPFMDIVGSEKLFHLQPVTTTRTDTHKYKSANSSLSYNRKNSKKFHPFK